jgi:hypothetical protein
MDGRTLDALGELVAQTDKQRESLALLKARTFTESEIRDLLANTEGLPNAPRLLMAIKDAVDLAKSPRHLRQPQPLLSDPEVVGTILRHLRLPATVPALAPTRSSGRVLRFALPEDHARQGKPDRAGGETSVPGDPRSGDFGAKAAICHGGPGGSRP